MGKVLRSPAPDRLLDELRRAQQEAGFAKQECSTLYPAAGGKAAAVVLLVHGLNMRPNMMQPLARVLQQSGCAVVRAALPGHGGPMSAFSRIGPTDWMESVARHQQAAAALAAHSRVPVHYVGFSLGAVLGCACLLHTRTAFQRMVLLAPPLFLRSVTGLLRLLRPFPRLVVPSLAARRYLAHYGTPIAAYRALETLRRRIVDQGDGGALNVPTLVLVDPGDELVACPGLERFIRERGLSAWQYRTLQGRWNPLRGEYHHQITDARSLGGDSWQLLQGLVIEHLLGQEQSRC